MSNYPDGLSDGTPGAPWNAPEPEPLICDICGALSEDYEVGDPCPMVYQFDDGSGHDTPQDVDCEGSMREQEICYCKEPESRCHCD